MPTFMILGITLFFVVLVALVLTAQRRRQQEEAAWKQLAKATGLHLDTSGHHYENEAKRLDDAFDPFLRGHAAYEVYGEYKGVEIQQRLFLNSKRKSLNLVGNSRGRHTEGSAQLPLPLPNAAMIKHRSLLGGLLTHKEQTTGDKSFDKIFITTEQMPPEWITPSLRESLMKFHHQTDEITLTEERLTWVIYGSPTEPNVLQNALTAAAEVVAALHEATAAPSSLSHHAQYTFPERASDPHQIFSEKTEVQVEVEVASKIRKS